MDKKTPILSGNVLAFPVEDRKFRCSKVIADDWDHGPSPEESLRVMRAFVGIKSKAMRENLTEMLEDASRARSQAPNEAKE